MNTDNKFTDHTVALFETHTEAEAAIKSLNDQGFDMRSLSIVGLDYQTEEKPIGFVNAGDRMWSWGKFGAFWGSIWGLLFGSAMLFVPGIGYVLFAGWIVAALEGAIVGGGVAALAGALTSIGIPENTVLEYETALKAGKFMVIVHSSAADVDRAKRLLGETTNQQTSSFSHSHADLDGYHWSTPEPEGDLADEAKDEQDRSTGETVVIVPPIFPGSTGLR